MVLQLGSQAKGLTIHHRKKSSFKRNVTRENFTEQNNIMQRRSTEVYQNALVKVFRCINFNSQRETAWFISMKTSVCEYVRAC
jgi:hypothetical protein